MKQLGTFAVVQATGDALSRGGQGCAGATGKLREGPGQCARAWVHVLDTAKPRSAPASTR